MRKKRGLAHATKEMRQRIGHLGGIAQHKSRGPKKGIKQNRVKKQTL